MAKKLLEPDLPLVVQTRVWLTVCRFVIGLIFLVGACAVWANGPDTTTDVLWSIGWLASAALSLGYRFRERMEIREDGMALSWAPVSLGPFPLVRRTAFVRYVHIADIGVMYVRGVGPYFRVEMLANGRRLFWVLSRWTTTNTRPALAVLAPHIRHGAPEIGRAVREWRKKERARRQAAA